jgi:hypothetical protein
MTVLLVTSLSQGSSFSWRTKFQPSPSYHILQNSLYMASCFSRHSWVDSKFIFYVHWISLP